jgi:hypothetical protein
MADGTTRLTQDGSAVLRVNPETRRMHLASLLPVTRPERGAFKPLESRFYYIAGGYLALQHFNQRSNAIVADLPERLAGCDLQLSIEYRDTQFNRVGGARVLNQILERWPQNTLQEPFPSAIVGSGRSDTSETVSTLSGMFQLPQVSPHSSAASLDDKGRFPFFARTTPSATSDGKAAVDYMHYLEASHIGVVYVLDSLGIAYDEAIQREARELGMAVYSVPYRFTDGVEELRQVFQRLKATGIRYIFAAIEPASWKKFIRTAVEEEILGNADYFWLFHSGMVGLVPEELDKETEYDIVRAIHGSGVVLKDFPQNPLVDAELVKLETDSAIQNDFVSLWSEPEMFDDFSFRYPGPNYPQYINFDAVMALGLAACSIDKEYFTGDDLYASLLETEFSGASDFVSFDNKTGTRKYVRYRVDNILMVDKGNGILGFRQEPTVTLEATGVNAIREFVHWDNTAQAPPILPRLKMDHNYIPTSFLVAGLALSGLMMLVSLGWICWTMVYKNRDVVKSSQPVFLVQLCSGTLLLSGSIIPMSFQEPTSKSGMDFSCMLAPWMYVIGYVIAFAALFSKSWRINKLFANGTQFRRIKVRVVDALFPLIILLTINVLLLTLWTIISPLRWERVFVESYDNFGRSRESYGICKTDDSLGSKVLISLIATVNILGLIFTNYQGYKTRNLPTSFDESFYVAVTNAALLESMILGFPVLYLVDDSPPSFFLVKAILISVVCLSILMPLFVPKHFRRNSDENVLVSALRFRDSSQRFSSKRSLAVPGGISGLATRSSEISNEIPSSEEFLGGSRIVRRESRPDLSFHQSGKKSSELSIQNSSGSSEFSVVAQASKASSRISQRSCEQPLERAPLPFVEEDAVAEDTEDVCQNAEPEVEAAPAECNE